LKGPVTAWVWGALRNPPHWVKSGMVSRRESFLLKKIIGLEYAGIITDMQSIVLKNAYFPQFFKNK
jgi:hypothetical protein